MRVAYLAAPVIIVVVFAIGCGQSGPAPTEAKGKGGKGTVATKEEGNPDTAGWWCKEHGVPEDICALCSGKLAAEFKKKGDWCKEHDRPETQCFKCHPDLEAKFAAQYEAKFGSKPPKPTE